VRGEVYESSAARGSEVPHKEPELLRAVGKRVPLVTLSLADDSGLGALIVVASLVALGHAVQLSNGSYSPEAFTWAAVAFALALAPAVLPRIRQVDDLAVRRLLLPGFALALGYQFAVLASSSPAIYLDLGGSYALSDFQFLIAIAAVACGFALARSARRDRGLTLVVLALYAAAGWWTLHASPRPHIDVFSIHQESIAALLHGVNPYTITFPNPYHTTMWFAPGAATYDRLLFGYVYPAWTLLLAVPGYVLAHDYRYSFFAAVVLSAALVAYAKRTPWSLAGVALFLFTPRSFFVLEQGWTEPALLIGLALAVFGAARTNFNVLAVGVGIAACSKQYSLIAAPAVLLLRPVFPDRRSFGIMILKAFGVAALVTLPLVLWGPKAYWYDVFGMQLSAPYRTDALGIPVAWQAKFGTEMPRVLQLAGPLVLATLTVLRAPRTVYGFAWAAGTLYFIFFMFRQGFCNYYYLVIGVFSFALATAQLDHRRASWQR